MKISITAAKGQLTQLVRRAEAGEEVIFTRHGHEAVRLTPIRPVIDARSRRGFIDQVRAVAAGKIAEGASAARSQDFLYDADGLPR